MRQGGRQWVAIALAVVVAVWGAILLAGRVRSEPQSADLVLFVNSIPFTLGLGALLGALRTRGGASLKAERRASDGAIRRFKPGTAATHWINAGGILLALGTGGWQYLSRLYDWNAALSPPAFHRLHFTGATLMLFAAASALTYWWVSGSRQLIATSSEWRQGIRGLAGAVPRPFSGFAHRVTGAGMESHLPAVGEFTDYEKLVSFPLWVVLIALSLATGIMQAYSYAYGFAVATLDWVWALHVAAMVMLAIKLLDHLRYVFSPGRWALLKGVVTTWVTEGYVRARHPGWFQAIRTELGINREPSGPRPGRPPAGASSRPGESAAEQVMRRAVAVIGFLWAGLSLYAAHLFVTGTLSGKARLTGSMTRALHVLGGLGLAFFALLLAWQCLALWRQTWQRADGQRTR